VLGYFFLNHSVQLPNTLKQDNCGQNSPSAITSISISHKQLHQLCNTRSLATAKKACI